MLQNIIAILQNEVENDEIAQEFLKCQQRVSLTFFFR